VLARLVLAVAALAVAGGFGLGAYQGVALRDGEKVLAHPRPLTAARVHSADRDLRDAATLNPDVQPAIDRGILAYLQRRWPAAEHLLLAATRREPDNIAAWAWLNNAARAAGDRRLTALSRTRILELRPRGTPPGG
jgi:predicted Zn-dependent protease